MNTNPEVEHWKVLFDSHAQDAALLEGDFKLLMKVEVASEVRRFVADQKKVGRLTKQSSSSTPCTT